MLDLISGDSQIVNLLPGEIQIDAGLQTRDKISQETIDRYAEDMRRGDYFPPLVVYRNGGAYALIKGFHRIKAHTKAFGEELPIRCEVMAGNRREALRVALSDNSDHGLQLSNDDKRKKVKIALADGEWGAWSDREIADLCKVSHPFVAKVRKEVTGNISSDQPAGRTYTNRHGSQSTMRTGGISASNKARSTLPTPPPLSSVIESGVAQAARGVLHTAQSIQADVDAILAPPSPGPAAPAAGPAIPPSTPVTPTMPADLEGAGWTLLRVGGTGNWYCLNRTLSKATATHEDASEAIVEAYVAQGTPWRDLVAPAAADGSDRMARALLLRNVYRGALGSLEEYGALVAVADRDWGESVATDLRQMIRALERAFPELEGG